MGEGDFLLNANLLEDDDLVDIVELVPIPAERVHISIKRFEFCVTRDSHVERVCCQERVLIEEVGGGDAGMVREGVRPTIIATSPTGDRQR